MIWVCLPVSHSCLTASPGVAERAEYHVMSHPQTFPRGLAPDYRGVAVGTTLGRRSKNLFTPQVSLTPSRPLHKATAVFGHTGGRLVVPNTGGPAAGAMFIQYVPERALKSLPWKSKSFKTAAETTRSICYCILKLFDLVRVSLQRKCENAIDRQSNMIIYWS